MTRDSLGRSSPRHRVAAGRRAGHAVDRPAVGCRTARAQPRRAIPVWIGFEASRLLAFRLSGVDENYTAPPAPGHPESTPRSTSFARCRASMRSRRRGPSWCTRPEPNRVQVRRPAAKAPGETVIAAWRAFRPDNRRAMGIRLLGGELCRSQLVGDSSTRSAAGPDGESKLRGAVFPTRLTCRRRRVVGRLVRLRAGSPRHRWRCAGTWHRSSSSTDSVFLWRRSQSFPMVCRPHEPRPASIAIAVRQRLAQLEPRQSITTTWRRSRTTRIGDAPPRPPADIGCGLFAVTDLHSLVCGHQPKTASYAVSLRRRGGGVAPRARRAQMGVVQQLMMAGVRIVGAATACGLILALLFTQTLSTMLDEVQTG